MYTLKDSNWYMSVIIILEKKTDFKFSSFHKLVKCLLELLMPFKTLQRNFIMVNIHLTQTFHEQNTVSQINER